MLPSVFQRVLYLLCDIDNLSSSASRYTWFLNLTNIHIFTMWLFSDVGMAHSDFPISNEFYTPTTCFLTFNLCAVVGNLMAFVRFVSLDCIKSGIF